MSAPYGFGFFEPPLYLRAILVALPLLGLGIGLHWSILAAVIGFVAGFSLALIALVVIVCIALRDY